MVGKKYDRERFVLEMRTELTTFGQHIQFSTNIGTRVSQLFGLFVCTEVYAGLRGSSQ